MKTCTVNGSLGGNDETRVNDTAPSDSRAEVLLLNNRTPIAQEIFLTKTSTLILAYTMQLATNKTLIDF